MFCIASIAIFTRASNIVDPSFSRAKPTLDYQRNRVLPMHFQQQVFPVADKRLWNIKNVDNVVAEIGHIFFLYLKYLFFKRVIFIKVFFFQNIFKYIVLQPWSHIKACGKFYCSFEKENVSSIIPKNDRHYIILEYSTLFLVDAICKKFARL